MVKIKLLGLSATGIKDGNCDKLVREALQVAERIGDVETQFLTLADKKIMLCKHCQWCIENRAPCRYKDDAYIVFDEIQKCDGLIIGSPTWLNTLSPHLLNLFSRARYIVFFTHNFRNKVVGLLTLGFLGYGLERALDTMRNVVRIYHMIPVAEASAIASTRAFGQRPAYLERGVLDDTWGMRQVLTATARVVEVTRMIKYASQAGITVPDEYKFTVTGSRLRPAEEKVFIEGVWRSKT
jgi:multimeric flavodoxin WrbA